ncbi:MAG: hypothetical protein MJZ31_06535 [Bacteroidales bacterium]|nr:hypothetical protein [Bacteroidales bacterium]
MTNKVFKKLAVSVVAVMFGAANLWNALNNNDIQSQYNSVVATSCQAFELSDFGVGSNWAYDQPTIGVCIEYIAVPYFPYVIPRSVQKSHQHCTNGGGNCIYSDNC